LEERDMVEMRREKFLLVGDNPFHGISHLTQERARTRGDELTPRTAADLIVAATENGANGFLFSVSETTLSILKTLRENRAIDRLRLFAIVPYAYEYVKLATQHGGIPGLARIFAKQLVLSGNMEASVAGLKGVFGTDPVALLKAYLSYETKRVESSSGRKENLHSVILHEVITDMALALDMGWFFKAYADFTLRMGVSPGFNTCNFAFLVRKLKEWRVDLSKATIVAPFNRVGFQMTPTKEECEKALGSLQGANVIAISILAAGYLHPSDGINYIATLPNIQGVAVGVSKKKHACETFKLLKEKIV
jgi:hypothetical protein